MSFYEAIKNACPTMKVINQIFLQEAHLFGSFLLL
jgi:hypothetical protein